MQNHKTESISGLHPVFSKRVYKNWNELEEEIRQIEETTEKGDVFEQFCYLFLLYHKDLYQIKEIWSDKIPGRAITNEIREKYKLEKTDYGVDGVSLLTDGRMEAWQAKFRSDQSSSTASELATFWTEAEYFDSKRTIANSARLPVVAHKKINHEQTLLDRLLELDSDFFALIFKLATHKVPTIAPVKYSPRPHQEAMLADIVKGLQQHDRGKLIAACGTGKTLVALWVSENEEMNASKVLVFAPSISLVGQTVREWVEHRKRDFEYLCVCSDKSIMSDIEDDDEFSDIDVADLDFSVTTTPDEIVNWIQSTSKKRQYIFSTYHSIPVIEEALKRLGDFKFDLAIFDEAHRTVGREDQFFSRGLIDENVPATKRLFMTATERLVNPAVKTYAKKSGVEIFSMDDETKYGPTLHDFNFGKAIEAGVIADYEIVLAVVNGEEEAELIKNNAYVFLDEERKEKVTLTADLLFKAGFLIKALVSEEVRKVITFHRSRKHAMTFDRALDLIAQNMSFGESMPVFTYVLGNQNSAERSIRISNFANAERGVLGNVHVLTEGVDIPIVDSVYFVDPKNSLIDIVQGIGRALRKPPNAAKVAKIIVPVIIPDNAQNLDEIEWDETLATFHSVIQSMRDQDSVLHQEIDSFNEFAISNGQKGTHIGDAGKNRRLRIITQNIKLPTGVSINDFLNKITLRVATANANPTGAKMGFSHLGKGERKSGYKPIFGILGDYNPGPYRDSLVIPTLERFEDKKGEMKRSALAINHNNVSHAERLGTIEPSNKDHFVLTKIGQALLDQSISFEDVFRNQMMLFSQSGIYSYRLIFEMLLELKSLDHVEFLFGPYVMQAANKQEFEDAIKRIRFIRESFPALELTSLSNREAVASQLNKISPVEIPQNEIWGDRSTPKNKFRYLANSITLFDVFEPRKEGYRESIRIKTDSEKAIRDMLKKSDPKGAGATDFYGKWVWLN